MASNEEYEIPDKINQIENLFSKKILRDDIMEMYQQVMNESKDFRDLFLKNVKYIEHHLNKEPGDNETIEKQSDKEFDKVLFSMPSETEFRQLMKTRSEQI